MPTRVSLSALANFQHRREPRGLRDRHCGANILDGVKGGALSPSFSGSERRTAAITNSISLKREHLEIASSPLAAAAARC